MGSQRPRQRKPGGAPVIPVHQEWGGGTRRAPRRTGEGWDCTGHVLGPGWGCDRGPAAGAGPGTPPGPSGAPPGSAGWR